MVAGPPRGGRTGSGLQADSSTSRSCEPSALSRTPASRGARPLELRAGVVRAPNERPGFHVRDAHGLARALVLGELVGRDPAIDRQVELRRLQVLAHRHQIAARVPQVGQRLGDLDVVSPIPRMRLDFVIWPGRRRLAIRSTSSERS